MDEPLSNLDALLRVKMRSEIKKLQESLKVTTIYVTHDQVEAMSMADRIAVINEGRIMQLGTPIDLYDRPENIFVAGFIGAPPMNFVEGSLVEEANDYLFVTDEFKLSLGLELGELVKKNARSTEIILGFRPEHAKILTKPEPNTIKAKVYVIEPLGRDIIVNVKVGGRLYKIIASPDIVLKPGQDIWLKLYMDKIHIFDKKSEKAII